jgi:UDP-N-acetylmuramoylalanine--D-glutamate ligase
VIAIGESAKNVQRAFQGTTELRTAGSMKEAVEMAHGIARAGEVVLLSPACASFDWFENYEHRGQVFKELVMGLPDPSGGPTT